MGEEVVTIAAGGADWASFEHVTVHASFKEAARSFEFKIAFNPDAVTAAWTFAAGTPIEIKSNGDLLCRGYVDRYQPRIVSHKRAEADVSGRSKSQDLCDCSALHKTGEWKNKTPLQILQELDQFGVGETAQTALDPVPIARIVPGESVFRCIEKLIRPQGVFLVGQADGSVAFAKGGSGRHANGLIEGLTILDGSADHNWANRHSKVIVRGQRALGHGKDNLQIEAQAEDGQVKRLRPVLVFNDSDIDKDRAAKRARYRRDREAGNSLRANITVQGFHDGSSQVWTPGFLVWTESRTLGIQQDMAIEKVSFEQSRHAGSLAKLTVCDPRALAAAAAGKGGSANGAWSTEAGSEATPVPDPSSHDPLLNQ